MHSAHVWQRSRALAALLLMAIGFATLTGGCGSPKTAVVANLTPETTVYIQGAVDTVNHRVHLYWFGSDPDGQVVAYQMRFVPTGGSTNPKWDTLYCALPGRCTDSVFTVPTGDSALVHTQFEIRSMDNEGAVDGSPAVQPLMLTNLAPLARISNKYRVDGTGRTLDSTFASATINWTVDDADGGGPGLRYRIWLNGNEAAYDSTAANTFTIPSARFLQGGVYRTGDRTIYLQAVDDGGRSGPLDSTRVFVRAPAKRDPVYNKSLLVIDDSRAASQNNQSADTLYVQTLRRNNFPDTCVSILRLEFSNPFRSAADLEQTLRLFDAVAWYRGYDFHSPSDFNASLTLKNFQDVVGAYILGGGRILLEGLYLIEGRNSFGALRNDFVTTYLNCRTLVNQFAFADSTVGITTAQSGLRLRSALYLDATQQMTALPSIQTLSPGLRGFVENDTSQVAFWAIQGQIAGLDSVYYKDRLDVPVAVSVGRPPGRVILLGYPSRAMAPPAATPFSRRPLAQLLLTGRNSLLGP
jgi:hypothetical protein